MRLGVGIAIALGLVGCGRDISRGPKTAVELVASKSYTPVAFANANHKVTKLSIVTVPKQIDVITGNAGNNSATLIVGLIGCVYKGGSPVSHPVTPEDVQAGMAYTLQYCTQTSPEIAVNPDQFITLQVNGDVYQGETKAKAVVSIE